MALSKPTPFFIGRRKAFRPEISPMPPALWRRHVQLSQAEGALRTGKSDLHLRPVFHQKTKRVQAHILVSFLSLALWRTLEQWTWCCRHQLRGGYACGS